MTLRNQTYSAVRWTAGAAAFRAGLQLTQVAVLARMLEPADFGLMAIVTMIIAFVSVAADAGINSAYLQRQNVTPEERSSLYWLNVLVGGTLSLLLALASPVLASLFGDPRLAPLIMLTSAVFLITSLGQQLRITAEKELNFRPVALIEISATLLGFAVALISAVSGLGVYSLVSAVLTTAGVTCALAWLLLKDGWRPALRLECDEIRSYLNFGGTVVIDNLINQFNRGVDLLLGGRMLTADALGFYSLPRQLVFHVQELINPIITRVSLPLIAKIQHDTSRVRTVYLQALNMVAATTAPVYLGTAFLAPEIVFLLFGEKWPDAAGILRILSVWGCIRSLGNPVGTLMLGLGRADLALKWNLFQLVILPPALWTGSHYGVTGIAWALLIVQCTLFIPSWYFRIRPLCQARCLEYMFTGFRPSLMAVVSFMPATYFCGGIQSSLLHVLATIAIAATIYMAFSYYFNRPWINALMQLFRPAEHP